MTSQEWADANGLSRKYVTSLLRQGRMLGLKQGRDWLIPINNSGNFELLTAKKFAEIHEYSHCHVCYLLRKGFINGKKLGRDWVIEHKGDMNLDLKRRRKRPR